jgi:vacuolar protein sorting-associated protein 54
MELELNYRTAKLVPWKRCRFCPSTLTLALQVFKSPREFTQHLRDFHCSKEGGSFVCRYGANRVCPSLPVEGVSDRDYEDHVARDHVSAISAMSTDGVTSTRTGRHHIQSFD